MPLSRVWVLGLCLLLLAGQPVSSPDDATIKKVQISAKRFKFRPAKIRMRVGETLEVTLKSLDVMHGFHVVGSHIDVTIPARGKGPVKVRFEPSQPGKYRFVCSHQCGAGHAQMRGVIEVNLSDTKSSATAAARSQK